MTRLSPRARRAFAVILTLLTAAFVAAQEAPFAIKSVDFQVKGRTLNFVLMQRLQVDGPLIGRSFADRQALDAYVADRRQILLNTRLFASVDAVCELSPDPSGGTAVKVAFAIVDTWNIVALPKPVISSNTGVDIYVKAKDYNFLGSMQTLTLSPEVKWDTHGNFSGAVSTSFTVPFHALGADWSLGVSESFQCWSDWETNQSISSLGLTYNVPGLSFPASITLSQGYNYNADVQYIGYYEPDPNFLTDSVSGTFHLPIGLSMGALGAVYYDPALSFSENWWPGVALSVWGRAGPSAYFSNMLSAGRIDWIGNQRQGVSAYLKSVSNYNFDTGDYIQDISLGSTGAWRDGERIGLVAQATALARPVGNFSGVFPTYAMVYDGSLLENDYLTGLGSYLRGIVDDRVNGVAGAFLEVSVPVKLFDFPTHLVIGKDWLDFELQAEPFVDAAAVLPQWGATYASEDWRQWLWASGGLEFLAYPVAMKNFIIRASLGWDLISILQNRSLTKTTWDGASPYEYYFGTGLAY